MEDVLAVVLAGGKGSRLYPLTRDRCKPAVPFAAEFRLIDCSLSIAIGNGIRRILVPTQYKPMSLERHINESWAYHTGAFQNIDIASPEENMTDLVRFEGTADALLKCKMYLERFRKKRLLILSGDHILNPREFDLEDMLDYHDRKGGALTILTKVTPIENGSEFGIAEVNESSRIVGFDEKPAVPSPIPGDEKHCLASMGIYIFEADELFKLLSTLAVKKDFGKDVIPAMLAAHRDFYAYGYNGTWEDAGKIKAYHEAHMRLLDETPTLDIQDLCTPKKVMKKDRRTNKDVEREEILLRNTAGHQQYIPSRTPSNGTYILTAGSSIDLSSDVRRSVIGRSRIESSALAECIIMSGKVRNCNLRRTIVDKNNVLEDVETDPDNFDYETAETDPISRLKIGYGKSGNCYFVDQESRTAIFPRKEPPTSLY